ncbi:hypothetical protein FACS1894186_8520 [Alphaproteobacteria bacterium]|nr:hypothetical protein FACS1894186_8520 [Alphaproteobacteria bacterium]
MIAAKAGQQRQLSAASKAASSRARELADIEAQRQKQERTAKELRAPRGPPGPCLRPALWQK